MKQQATSRTRHSPVPRDAAHRMTKRTNDTDGTKTKVQHPSYLRLIEAAAKMRGIYGENAIAEALYSDKTRRDIAAALRSNDTEKAHKLRQGAISRVNNWGRRGVAIDGALDAERYLGIPATYILNDTLPPCDEWQTLRASNRIESPAAVYKSNELREINEIAEELDQDSLTKILGVMKILHAAKR